MLKRINFLAIFSFVSLSGYSQEEETLKLLPEIQRIQDTYEESLKVASIPIVTLGNKYIEALNHELEKAQRAGDFKGVKAIRKSVEEFNKGEPLDGSSDLPAVAKLERIASQQIKIRLKTAEAPALKAAQIRVAQLKQALKDLTKSGNFESAEKVDQFIKSLPTRYDSSWAQSEIKRVASNDGVKVPVTVAEGPSILFGEKEKPKKPALTAEDPPEISSVEISPKQIKSGESLTIVALVRSFSPPNSLQVNDAWKDDSGSTDWFVTGNYEKLKNQEWQFKGTYKPNEFRIGEHTITRVTVRNEALLSNHITYGFKFTISQDGKIEEIEDFNPLGFFENIQSERENKTKEKEKSKRSVKPGDKPKIVSVKISPKRIKVGEKLNVVAIIESYAPLVWVQLEDSWMGRSKFNSISAKYEKMEDHLWKVTGTYSINKFWIGSHVITNCEAWSEAGFGSNREPMKYNFIVTEE